MHLDGNDPQIAAESILLAPAGLDSAALDRVMSVLARGNVSWADIYLQETISRDWLLEEGAVKSGSFTIDRGAGLRSVVGSRASLAYSNSLEKAALLRAARTAGTMTATGAAEVSFLPHSAPAVRHSLYECACTRNEFDDAASQRQIALLESVDRYARALDRAVTDVLVSYQTERDAVLVRGLDGRHLGDIRPMSYLSITVTVEKNGRRERATAGGGGRSDLRHFTKERVERWVHQAVEEALHNLEASPALPAFCPLCSAPAGRAFSCTKRSATAWKATSFAKALQHSPTASASVLLLRASLLSTTARWLAGVAHSLLTMKARRHHATF